MAIRLDGAKLGGFARRFAAQAAMSATIMTGLHVAASNGFAPADWLFGPAERAGREASADAPDNRSAEAGRSESSPDILFIAIPAAEAFPNGYGPAAKQVTGRATPPDDRTAISAGKPTEQAASARPPEPGPAHGPGYAGTAALPAVVATPTPRPVLRTSTPRPAPEPVEVAEMRADRLPFDLTSPAGVPELARDAVPEPPLPENDGFGLSDLVPERRMLIGGAMAVGLHARDTIEGAALGAMALVGMQ